MKQVYKYILRLDRPICEIPKGGTIRHVDEQLGNICVWVEVDPDQPKEKRRFEIYGTGHTIREDMGVTRVYLGSVKLEGGALIFHIYEHTGI